MTSQSTPAVGTIDDTARYWVLVHGGKIHPVDWDDGERLLSLSAAVRSGSALPQPFTFCPRGTSAANDGVTVYVRPDEPLQLITAYEQVRKPKQSTWFG
jgi:hypothetical protein